jgi:hypothetical protein
VNKCKDCENYDDLPRSFAGGPRCRAVPGKVDSVSGTRSDYALCSHEREGRRFPGHDPKAPPPCGPEGKNFVRGASEHDASHRSWWERFSGRYA